MLTTWKRCESDCMDHRCVRTRGHPGDHFWSVKAERIWESKAEEVTWPSG